MPEFVVSVDLGQARDYTAITVLEVEGVTTNKTREILSSDGWDPRNRTVPIIENHYSAVHLERLPLGTAYPKQIARIKEVFEHLSGLTYLEGHGVLQPVHPKVSLVVDKTGVGAPVVDQLRQERLEPVAVTITGGDNVTRDGRDYRVPKRDLASTVQVLLDNKRLLIAKDLPEAKTLMDEFLAFKVSISLKGHDSYGNDAGSWREAPHDDLVLAVALGCWWGENTPPHFTSLRRAFHKRTGKQQKTPRQGDGGVLMADA